MLSTSLVVALTTADVLVRMADLGFQPVRNRANDDAILERQEFRARVVTNAVGFRDPRLPGPKPAGTMRIVAVGDSFTQGYGVEEDDAYPRVLEEILNQRQRTRQHEVINLGVPGASPLDYLANLRDVGLGYEPDLVIVGLMANDVNDIRALREYGGRMLLAVLRQVQTELTDDRPVWKTLPSTLWPSLYAYAGSRLPLRARDADAHASTRGESVSGSRRALPAHLWRQVLLRVGERYGRRSELETAVAQLPEERVARVRRVLTGEYQFEEDADQRPMLELMALVQPRVYADMVLLPPAYDAAWDETTRALRQIDAVARRAGARTLIAFFPAAYQVSSEGWHAWTEIGFEADVRTLTDASFAERLSAFGAEAGIPTIDLLSPLRARADEKLYYPIDGHWTPRGQRVAAELLAAAILDD